MELKRQIQGIVSHAEQIFLVSIQYLVCSSTYCVGQFPTLNHIYCVSVLEQAEDYRGSDHAKPGQAQRLSSLTFGCFHVQGKSPQVRTGPMPVQRSTGGVCTTLTPTDSRRLSAGQADPHIYILKHKNVCAEFLPSADLSVNF